MSRSAIVIKEAGVAKIEQVPLPKLQAGDVLVRPTCVALNPIDQVFIDYIPAPGAVVGNDFAGIVEELGPDAASGGTVKKGDRVAGFTQGANKLDLEAGSFATLVKAPADLLFKTPSATSDQEASSLPVGIVTAGIGLFGMTGLKLPLFPESPGQAPSKDTDGLPVLIYGASSATGAMAVQLAKLSKMVVFATCSPSNFDYVRSLGADHVFDYKSASCADDIKKAASSYSGGLANAVDAIAKGTSTAICYAALSGAASKTAAYAATLPVQVPEGGVEGDVKVSMGRIDSFEIFGKTFFFGPDEFPPRPGMPEFARDLIARATNYVAEGKIKGHNPDVRTGGLEAVLAGLQEFREGKVSGKKIIVEM